jgi:hypothetical protein
MQMQLDLESAKTVLPAFPDAYPCLLGSTMCSYFWVDGWTAALTVWMCFQLLWITVLNVIQGVHIGRANTTNEGSNWRKYSYMWKPERSFVADSSTAHAASIGTASAQKSSSQSPSLAAAGLQKQHRYFHDPIYQNPFDRGCFINCFDFWFPARGVWRDVHWATVYDVPVPYGHSGSRTENAADYDIHLV